jgi:hypothetical protein
MPETETRDRVEGIKQLREALRKDPAMQAKLAAAFPGFARALIEPRSEEWDTLSRWLESGAGTTKCGVWYGPDADGPIINC